MYHGDKDGPDDTAKVWADFPDQKGLVELIHVSSGRVFWTRRALNPLPPSLQRHGSENEDDLQYRSGNEPGNMGFGHLVRKIHYLHFV